jgi:HK97 family phage major capsid protein
MSGYAQMLAEKRQNTWKQAQELLERAATEKRELTAEENEQYERMTTELTESRSVIDKIVADEKAMTESEEALRKLAEQRQDPTAPPVKAPEGSMDEQLRSFLKGEKRELSIMPTREDLQAINQRSLVKGTNSAGGFTVPTTFYSKLWAHLIQTANLLNAGATVLTTDNGDQIQIPTTTAHSTAALVAEGAAIGSSDPAFAQRVLGAFKYGVLIQVARELLDDTGVDLEGYLAMQAGRAVGNAFGTDLVVGNGASKPNGILQNTTLGVTGGAGVVGAFTFDNLIDLFYSVIPQYRSRDTAAWLMNDASVGAARKLKDGQGRYLWEPSLQAGAPDTMLNKPVFTDPNVPTIALSAKSVIFGDISAYFARVVNGVRFEQSLDFAFNTDLVTFRCLIRGDGILVDQTGAVKHFAGNAA